MLSTEVTEVGPQRSIQHPLAPSASSGESVGTWLLLQGRFSWESAVRSRLGNQTLELSCLRLQHRKSFIRRTGGDIPVGGRGAVCGVLL